MLARKENQVRHPDRHTLNAISEGFEEIEGYFEFGGFSAPQTVAPEQRVEHEPQQEEHDGEDNELEDYYGDDEESIESKIFDREEIEVAIDLFVSHLVKAGILKKSAVGKQPTLAQTFQFLFGEGHEIVEIAKSFESHIKGYFGAVSYDAMQAAFDETQQIRDIINKELGRHG